MDACAAWRDRVDAHIADNGPDAVAAAVGGEGRRECSYRQGGGAEKEEKLNGPCSGAARSSGGELNRRLYT